MGFFNYKHHRYCYYSVCVLTVACSAAYSKKKTLEEVQEAVQCISIKNIQDWKKQRTIVSKLATLKK